MKFANRSPDRRLPTMLSIPKTVEMDEETKFKNISCKFLAGNAVEDFATIEELLRICNFAILLQWAMKLEGHLH